MLPKICKITKIVQENPTTKTFFIDEKLENSPGQFYMIWLPGIDEKPIAISLSKNKTAITVRSHGKATKQMTKLKVGDKLGFRGPYGNPFTIHKNKKTCIIGGGIGIAGITTVAEVLPKAHLIFGAQNKNGMMLHKNFKASLCTDDGSLGKKGFTSNLFEDLLKKEKIEFVYCCGPEIMIKAVMDICKKHKIPMEASLERYMKCGIGICASCVCSDKLVCKDGPVFTLKQLEKMPDFNKYALSMSGKKVKLKEYVTWTQ